MRAWLRRAVGRLLHHCLYREPYYLFKRFDEVAAAAQVQQLLLTLRYRELARAGGPLPPFDDVEFSVYSQAGEDGILVYIFALIGTTNKVAVEIGAGNGVENNTANLIIHHGWTGYLFDADPDRVQTAREFYGRIRQTSLWPPAITCSRVTPASVDEVVRGAGATGPVDLFSLDIDGIDYWVWEALTVIEPRVVVVEFNNLWPASAAMTVPNDPDFRAEYNSRYGADYSGATLGAFVKLATRKGYRLVGCQRYGFNAFFVRNGIGEDLLPAVDPATCLTHPFAEHARTVRQPGIRGKPWVTI